MKRDPALLLLQSWQLEKGHNWQMRQAARAWLMTILTTTYVNNLLFYNTNGYGNKNC